MPSSISPAPVEDRCPKSSDGVHAWRPPTFPGFPHRCEHCSERREIATVDIYEALRLLAGGAA